MAASNVLIWPIQEKKKILQSVLLKAFSSTANDRETQI